MTTNEIIDRLFMLAQARLKIRLGAFEQFKNTVKFTAQGDALKAAACEMPRAWHQGLTMGLPEAAIQIDAHLLAVVDRWASTESKPVPISPLDGFSLAPAIAPAPIHEAGTQPQPAPVVEAPDPERRLIALRALGGTARWRRGRGSAQAWQFTCIQMLVAQEKAGERKRSDEKTIRADLREAAQAESMAKRNGPNK